MKPKESLHRISHRIPAFISLAALSMQLLACQDSGSNLGGQILRDYSLAPTAQPTETGSTEQTEQDGIEEKYATLMKSYLPRLATEVRTTEDRGKSRKSTWDIKGIQSRFPGKAELIFVSPVDLSGTAYQAFLFPKSDQLKRRGNYAIIPDSPYVVLVTQNPSDSRALLTNNQAIIARVLTTTYRDIPALSTREMREQSAESQWALSVIQEQWAQNGMGTIRIQDYLFTPDSTWEHDVVRGEWRRELIKVPATCLTGC